MESKEYFKQGDARLQQELQEGKDDLIYIMSTSVQTKIRI